ncbi:hypothetical protein [Fusobacterium nucleatum]|uniref:YobI family P-loop NTPase n=1 Tax=Fusobacterium nucleatum TaxID=851 RepID=UPI0030CD328C
MKVEKSKFNALIPEILEENKQIYTEALDYAFSNKDIKNIAITGIYGAGKSTVWNTYKEYRLNKESNKKNSFKNVITISLGKYTDSSQDTQDNNKTEKEIDNRVEKQLINQMLSQIKYDKIPFSKYKFKENISTIRLISYIGATISFLASILMWVLKEEVVMFLRNIYENYNNSNFMYLSGGMFFWPIVLFLHIFYKENKVKLSKVSFKIAEANVKEENNDETILDRDIKEIVYLLDSSETTVVVFEDLDRYDNIEIFTKLRELNFLLNSYIKTNGDRRTVRFIYMLKDSLFFSKNRTKFFDFILPIVPVVDSKTSENRLIELLKGVENLPDRDVLTKISLYLDDMRLLKNIVNEYIIYSKIIPFGQINLESNKLFALITLKNIFPNEFDLLQEDKGFIKAVFNKLENSREIIVNNLKLEIKNIKEKIEFINNSLENDKFEAMALMIPTHMKLDGQGQENKTWSNFLKEWDKKPNETFYINHATGGSYFNYKEFLDRYILISSEKKSFIEKFPKDRTSEMSKLNLNLEKIKREINNIEILSYKELISEMTSEEKDGLFSIPNFKIIEDHYFPLIRFLIVDGLLDETYWYYKGNFEIDTSSTLKQNDVIYMKGLLEGKEQDIFLDVETPNEIINRLNYSDFNRFNILNKTILITCLEKNYADYVVAITNSVDNNDKYKELVKILDEYELDLIEKYTDILVQNNMDKLDNILNVCENFNIPTFKNILISLLINKNILTEDLEMFRKYIEPSEGIIDFIPDKDFEVFLKNITLVNIKFEDLTKSNCSKRRLTEIEKIQAFRIDIKNIIFITKTILDKNIDYGNLLNEIQKSEQLISSQNYIIDNFEDFIPKYIDGITNEELYTNNEEILIKILKSNISEKIKLKYIEKNEIIISNLDTLKDNNITSEIIDSLLKKDKIKFCSENLNIYWNMNKKISEEFISYIDRNTEKTDSEEVLANNVPVCNILINSSIISDSLFEIVINYASEQINDINHNLEQDRINLLIKRNLVNITEENIEVLLENSYEEELVLLVTYGDQDTEDDAISKLLTSEISDELIYRLVNSKITNENAIKLIELITDDVLIEKINQDKEVIIKEIISRGLSDTNINYICINFETFKLKDEFVEFLNDRNKIEFLDDKNLTKSFMKYVLTLENIEVSTKVSLIVSKIRNKTSIESLKEYISSVEEISDISSVWNNSFPLLDNLCKKEIGNALIENEYVKLRRDNRISKR